MVSDLICDADFLCFFIFIGVYKRWSTVRHGFGWLLRPVHRLYLYWFYVDAVGETNNPEITVGLCLNVANYKWKES